MIKAKTVVPDRYWILRDGQRKIGNIESDGSVYTVSINGERANYTTLNMIQQRVPIDFEMIERTTPVNNPCEVHGYPTTAPAHNAIFDVKHQLPLWTSDPNSRSWYAAGWYRVRQQRTWKTIQCPKLIMLQRYQYQGPYRSQAEAAQQ
jgi:hypothetical protein